MTETITTILCIGLLSIYALLGVTFLIHSIADIFDKTLSVSNTDVDTKATFMCVVTL